MNDNTIDLSTRHGGRHLELIVYANTDASPDEMIHRVAHAAGRMGSDATSATCEVFRPGSSLDEATRKEIVVMATIAARGDLKTARAVKFGSRHGGRFIRMSIVVNTDASADDVTRLAVIAARGGACDPVVSACRVNEAGPESTRTWEKIAGLSLGAISEAKAGKKT